MNRVVDPRHIPATWGEIFDSIGRALSVASVADFRAHLFQNASFHFGRQKGTPVGTKRRPWGMGCTDGPIYVALYDGRNTEADLDQQRYGGARLFCFVRVELSSRLLGTAIPAHLISTHNAHPRDDFVAMDFAVIQCLEAHSSVSETDPRHRPVCPNLNVNHALWQPKVVHRRGTSTPGRLQQLQTEGVAIAQWRSLYDTACFVAVPSCEVAHSMNVAPDPDTGGLLQTISFTGYTGRKHWGCNRDT